MFAGEFVVRGRQERASASALRHNVLAVAVGAFHERDEFRRGPAFGYPTCHRLKSNCVRWKSSAVWFISDSSQETTDPTSQNAEFERNAIQQRPDKVHAKILYLLTINSRWSLVATDIQSALWFQGMEPRTAPWRGRKSAAIAA
jgi:hypothetical protein